MPSFGSRLEKSLQTYGALCVGIDAHSGLLDHWGLADSVQGLESFAFKTLEACVSRVGIIKPQVSFFERFGSAGFAVLEKLATEASDTDLQVIMDAKRGDIGSTMDGYFDAWLGSQAPFICDALTVSPFLGLESLVETMDSALSRSKGLFVLAATSNPEAKELQRAKTGNGTIASNIYARICEINRVTSSGPEGLGSIGVVIGATLNFASVGLGNLPGHATATPILAPGFGAQGAELSDLENLFGSAAPQVIASVSRSVLQAGPIALPKMIDNAKAQLAKQN